jgi:hypothetical protein
MPGNKPVKKGVNQTEKRAKGLLSNVGDYKGKTLNLTKKQLGASGMKASSARKIAISQTRYDKASKKVLGPMGKPITGRVDLGGGNIAVYKNGVRVRAQKSSSGSSGSGSGSGDSPTPTARVSANRPSAAKLRRISRGEYRAAGAKSSVSSPTRGGNYGSQQYYQQSARTIEVWDEKSGKWVPIK